MAVQSEKISPEAIRKALLRTQASVIHDRKFGQKFLLPSKMDSDAKEIYRVMRIKMQNKLTKIKRSNA